MCSGVRGQDGVEWSEGRGGEVWSEGRGGV